MPLLLLIDTAVNSASVCIVRNKILIEEMINSSQKDHAAWLHQTIHEILLKNQLDVSQLDGVVISAGPGSYTGLRVGMSAAKGLCYALKKPLITINTLKMMASGISALPDTYLCPLIDARRMEVFTAIYNQDLQEIMSPCNLILNEDSFREVLNTRKVLFFGNGSDKFKKIANHANAAFLCVNSTASNMMELAFSAYENQDFADLAYSEPYYGKAFYLPSVKPLI